MRFDSGEELAEALLAAGTGALSPALVVRAEALAQKHPWGKTA